MSNGCLGLLAMIWDTKEETLNLEEVPIVREYFDIFSEDLPKLAPAKEIGFGVDLILDTQSIFIPTYRMEPAELRELK